MRYSIGFVCPPQVVRQDLQEGRDPAWRLEALDGPSNWGETPPQPPKEDEADEEEDGGEGDGEAAPAGAAGPAAAVHAV